MPTITLHDSRFIPCPERILTFTHRCLLPGGLRNQEPTWNEEFAPNRRIHHTTAEDSKWWKYLKRATTGDHTNEFLFSEIVAVYTYCWHRKLRG